MSYNVQDKLTFIVEIQKRGDVSQITKIANDINAALSNATKGQRAFTTEAVSSSTKVNAAVNKNIAVYNSLGKAISSSYTPITQFNAAVGKTVATTNQGYAATQKYGSGFAVLGNNARSSISFITQFDNTVRRSATTMNAGVASANAYSAIFKTIPAAVQAGTAAVNANTAALTQNTAKAQQYGAVMRTVTSSTAAQGAAFTSLNTALAANVRANNQATASEERRNQSIISNVRGMSTMILGFAMLNNSMVDYNLNQQSMADLNEKVASLQERLTTAIEEHGEASFQAAQASNALEKAQRAIRYESREMTNQLQNQMFLYILIGQEIVSNAIPAFLRWGETLERLKGGFSSFLGLLGRARGGISEFGKTLATGTAPLAVYSERLRQMPTDIDMVTTSQGRFRQEIMNSDGTIRQHAGLVGGLSEGYYLYNASLQDTEKSQTRAGKAADTLRGGFSRLGGVIGVGGGAGIIAGLGALAIATALYSTNAGGAKTAMDNFGMAVGSAHPLLKAFGDGLVGIGGALGLTGESIGTVNNHFRESNDAMDDFASGWHDTVQSMVADSNVLVQAIGGVAGYFGNLGKAVSDKITGKPEIDFTKSREEAFQQYFDEAQSVNFLPLSEKAVRTEFDEKYDKGNPNDPESEAYKERQRQKGLRARFDSMDVGKFSPSNYNADATQDYLQALRDESELFTQLEEDTAKYNKVYNDYLAGQKIGTIQGEILRNGQAKYNALMAQEATDLQINAEFLRMYGEGLQTAAGKSHEFAKGKQEQIEKGLEEEAQQYRLAGAYSALYDQVRNGTALETAYATGAMETNIALLEREKAISKQTGALDAYNNAIVSGQVQQLAFNEGINQQREALYASVEAASNAQGQLSQLNEQLADGTRQAAAFQQGYDETALSIKMGNVEIAAAQGAFNAWADAAASGEIATQAFQRGILAQNDALKQSYETMHESAGALQQFQRQLATGLPQGIAFTQTLLDMGMAAQSMDVELAKATASLMFNQAQFKNSLIQTRDAIVDLNGVTTPTIANLMHLSAATATAFQKGRDSVYGWVNSLVEMQAAEVGAIYETKALADMIGIQLPSGLKGGSAALQEFLALALQAPEAIGKVRDELKGIFDGIIDGFADALGKGQDELDDAIDEFADSLGIKFNHGVKEAFEAHAGTSLMVDLSKQFASIFVGIGQNLNVEDFNGLKEGVTGRLQEVMDGVLDDMEDGPMKDKVQKSMDTLMNLFNNADVSDMQSPTGITTMMGNLGMAIMGVEGTVNNFGTTWDAYMSALATGNIAEANRLLKEMSVNGQMFAEIKFDALTGQFVAVQRAIELTEEAAQELEDTLEDIGNKYEGMNFTDANVKSQFDEVNKAYEEKGIYETITVIPNNDGKIGEMQTTQSEVTTPIAPTDESTGIGQITTAAAAAEAAIKQLEATAKTSAAVITQQFASMAMNIVAVLGEIPKASVGMFQLIAAAASGTIPLVAAQFTAMGVAASAELGKIPVAAVANFELIAAAASGSIPVVAAQFTAMGVAASTELGKIPIAAVTNFQLIAAAASGNIPVVAAQFTAMATAALTELGKIPIGAINQFALIAGAVTQAVPAVEAEFAKMTLSATTEFGKIVQAAVRQFKLAGDQARQVTVGVTTHFNQAAANAQGVLSGMEGDAKESFGEMGDSAVAVAEGVDTHFGKAADDGIALMDALERSVVANMDAMAKKAGEVASAVAKIGTSADTAKGKVDALASAINRLQDKTVTITYRIRTVGSAPSGARRGAFKGTVMMGEGGYLDALDAVDRTVVTGESGSEFVRTINKFGHMKEQIVDNIKSFTLGAGEAIQVQPLEGQYAKDFKAKHGNIINMASGQNWYYQNQNGVINTNIPGLLPDNTPGSGIGNSQTSPFSDVAPFVPKNGSTIGKPYSDGTDTVFTADPYNRNLTASEWGKSYLGGGRWYDPMTGQYYTGMGGTPTPGTGGGGGSPGNGNGGGSGPTQIVTTPDGRVRIEQGNGKQSIIIDGKEMLPQQQMSAFSDSVDQFSETVDQQQQGSNANGLNGANGANGIGNSVSTPSQNGANGSNGTSYTDSRGNNFNFQNDSNSNSNVFGNNGTNVGNDPLGSSSDTGAGGNNTNQNFGNGKYYRSTNGVVETNMTPAEIEEMNRRFPFLHLDPSKGVGGGGSTPGGGTPVGKIWNLDLPSPTSNPNAAIPFNYENDPMGWHNYGLIPDPLFRERADRPDVIGGTPGSPPGNGGPNQPGFPFDFSWIADLLRQILGAIRLGRNTQVNIGSRNIIDIVQGGIMDGFSNFK